MKIKFIGIFDNKINYKIELNSHIFDYYTGLGWVKIMSREEKQVLPEDEKKLYELYTYQSAGYDVLISSLDKREYNRLYPNSFNRNKSLYIKRPTENDVLECLKTDCEVRNMSFSEFCDNFGYSNDSLKALDIYRACEDTARKLRNYKFPENLGE